MGGWGVTPALAAVVFLATVAPAAGDAGLPDSSFGTNGVVTTELTPRHDTARAVAVQPDGKVVVVGSAGYGFGSYEDWGLARYLPDGQLDPTFGNGGIVVLPIGTTVDAATDVAQLPDGKVLVSGSTFNFNNYDFAVGRFLPDGTLDTTFGTNGIAQAAVSAIDDDIPTAMAVQPDGAIVLAGFVHVVSDTDFAVVRFLPGGQPDPGFGTGGKAITSVGTSVDAGNAVALQSDGKIVVAGWSAAQGADWFSFVRYAPNGTLDPSFGTGGKVMLLPYGTAQAVLVEPDGRIAAAGYARPFSGEPSDFALARLLPNGAPDPSFGTNGTVRTPLSAGFDLAFALARQPDGKLVVVGQADSGADQDAAVARYTTSGALDPTFGVGGWLTLPVGFDDDVLYGVALQPDGRIVAAGRAWTTPTNLHFAVLRLLNDPICGDGTVAPGEECDDGNTAAGDCCSPACRREPAGTECGTDADPCTGRFCDGAGACLVLDTPGPCDDGVLCNGADACQAGACTHAGDPCASGPPCGAVCNEATATCIAPAGTPCPDDGDGCTTDVCDGAAPVCTHPRKSGGCC
jgi:uncharacterized delta-60 repeat protein